MIAVKGLIARLGVTACEEIGHSSQAVKRLSDCDVRPLNGTRTPIRFIINDNVMSSAGP